MRSRTMLFSLIVAASVLSAGCERVNAGYAGVKVNLYGSGRGVDSVPLVSGMVWYNPFTTDVIEYPIFVQTTEWTRSDTPESPGNEEVSFNTKDKMVVTADISISYFLIRDRVPHFFAKYRQHDLRGFTHGYLKNVARNVFNEISVAYTVEEIYAVKKDEFLTRVRAGINKDLDSVGVVIEQFGFVGAPRLPPQVVEAINNTIAATQQAMRAENELRTERAEAQKRIAKAQGEAESNRLLTASLSPQLLRWRAMDIQQLAVSKWNGQLSTYSGGGAVPFLQIQPEK